MMSLEIDVNPACAAILGLAKIVWNSSIPIIHRNVENIDSFKCATYLKSKKSIAATSAGCFLEIQNQ